MCKKHLNFAVWQINAYNKKKLLLKQKHAIFFCNLVTILPKKNCDIAASLELSHKMMSCMLYAHFYHTCEFEFAEFFSFKIIKVQL